MDWLWVIYDPLEFEGLWPSVPLQGTAAQGDFDRGDPADGPTSVSRRPAGCSHSGRRRVSATDPDASEGLPNMRCPYCKRDKDHVVDSRSSGDGSVVRRRRHCVACDRRFTTYERVEESPLRVIKKNGSREPFSRAKLMEGLLKACEKRPVTQAQLEEVVNRIELDLYGAFDKEVPTIHIGERVMGELRGLDQVAYVRFASVYRDFQDVMEFMAELQPMLPGRDSGDSGAADENPAPSPACESLSPLMGGRA